MFSNSRAVNILAGARIFLFASRDVWFVVGLPVFLRTELGWSFWQAGAFLAVWVIGYGVVQASAPRFVRRRARPRRRTRSAGPRTWLALCAGGLCPAAIGRALNADLDPGLVLIVGLLAFGVIFALNSAVHSYLILAYADGDKVAMNVGFYYMANAGGRLTGTVLSGLLYPMARPHRMPLGIGRVPSHSRPAIAPPAKGELARSTRPTQLSQTA